MRKNKKVLIVVTSHDRYDNSSDETGYWLEEITHFYWEIAKKGCQIDLVSPNGGKPPLDRKSGDLRDAANQAFLNHPELKNKLENTLKPNEVNPDEYIAVYYAGGHGAMWDFPDNKELNSIAQLIYEANGFVLGVCHGVAGLLNLKNSKGDYLIAQQPVTGFSNLEEGLIRRKKNVPFLLENELTSRGARYQKAWFPFTPSVAMGDRILTGQNPQSSRALGKAFVNFLERAGDPK